MKWSAPSPSREERAAKIKELGKRSGPKNSETILKEYELLRGEITTSMQIQQQILTFGITTIGLLAGAAFVGKNDHFRSELLVVFLPVIAYLAVTIWFSEVMRMLRAGRYQLTLEKELDKCEDGSLRWEYIVERGRLRAGKWHFGALDPDKLRWISVTLMFGTLAVAAIMLGWHDATWPAQAFAVFALPTAATVLYCLYRLRMSELDALLFDDALQFDDALLFDDELNVVRRRVRELVRWADELNVSGRRQRDRQQQSALTIPAHP
jgi:uncharacterized protein (DUF983 family)